MANADLKNCRRCLTCFIASDVFLGWFGVYLIILCSMICLFFIYKQQSFGNKTSQQYTAEIEYLDKQNIELLKENNRLLRIIPDGMEIK